MIENWERGEGGGGRHERCLRCMWCFDIVRDGDESHTTRIPRQTLLSLPPTSSSPSSSSSRICPSSSAHFIYCFLFIYQFAVGVCMFQLISLYIRALLEGISAGTLSELAMRTPKSQYESQSQTETNEAIPNPSTSPAASFYACYSCQSPVLSIYSPSLSLSLHSLHHPQTQLHSLPQNELQNTH